MNSGASLKQYAPGRAAQGQPQWVTLELATMWVLPLAVHTTRAWTDRAAADSNSERTSAKLGTQGRHYLT